MWELEYKGSWVLKNWCFWTAVLEKTLESPLDCSEIQPVHPEGDQSWVFIGRSDVEAPILWSPDSKSWLTGKHPDAGKDWRQEEKGTTEDEPFGWHQRLNAHEFKQAPEMVKDRKAWYAGKCPCKLIMPWFSGLVNLLLNIAKGLWNGDIILDYPGRSSRIPWISKSVEPFLVAIWERWYK